MEVVATRENQKSPFKKKSLVVWSWNLLCVLEMSFPLISHKPGEILIFRTFLMKFLILAYGSLKTAILNIAMIITSLRHHTWDNGTYFGMYGKRRPLAILWYQLNVSGGFKFTGVGNHPPPSTPDMLPKKGLVRWGLIIIMITTDYC